MIQSKNNTCLLPECIVSYIMQFAARPQCPSLLSEIRSVKEILQHKTQSKASFWEELRYFHKTSLKIDPYDFSQRSPYAIPMKRYLDIQLQKHNDADMQYILYCLWQRLSERRMTLFLGILDPNEKTQFLTQLTVRHKPDNMF